MGEMLAKCSDGKCRIRKVGGDADYGVPISELPKIAIEHFKQGVPSSSHSIEAYTKYCEEGSKRIHSRPVGGETVDEFVKGRLYFVDGLYKCHTVLRDNVSDKEFRLQVSMTWSGEVEHYKRKIEQDPENPWLHRDLARTMFKNGEYRETIECVRKASMLDPQYCEDFFYAGISKMQLSDEDGAIQDLDEAIGLNPEYGAAYYYRGAAKQRLYRYEEAIADYDKAIELMPKEPGLYYGRGLAESEFGLYSKAIESFERAIELGFENKELALNEIDVAESKLEGGCGCSAVGSSSINTAADQSLLSLLMVVLFD